MITCKNWERRVNSAKSTINPMSSFGLIESNKLYMYMRCYFRCFLIMQYTYPCITGMVCLQENFCIGAYTVRQGTNFIIYSGIVTEILFMIFLGRIFWSFTSQPWISFWYISFFLHLICLLVDIVTRLTIWCRETFIGPFKVNQKLQFLGL